MAEKKDNVLILKLKQLGELYKEGLLTKEEFEEQKRKLLQSEAMLESEGENSSSEPQISSFEPLSSDESRLPSVIRNFYFWIAVACIFIIGGAITWYEIRYKKTVEEKQLREFVENFASKASRNQIMELTEDYPDIEFADSIYLDYNPENIVIEPQEKDDSYNITLSPDVSLILEKGSVGGNPRYTIVESKGLFAYPTEMETLAKKTGLWDESLTDVNLALRMKNKDFFDYIDQLISYVSQSALKLGEPECEWDGGIGARDGTQTIHNLTDVQIESTDYNIIWHDGSTWYDNQYDITWTEAGIPISPGGKVTMNIIMGGHRIKNIKKIQLLLSRKQIIERFLKFNGDEYPNFIQIGKYNDITPANLLKAAPVNEKGNEVYFYKGFFQDDLFKKYPIMIAFILKDDKIIHAYYKNVDYNVIIKMKANIEGKSILLYGKERQNDFSIRITLSDNETFMGSANAGNQKFYVELKPTDETFSF